MTRAQRIALAMAGHAPMATIYKRLYRTPDPSPISEPPTRTFERIFRTLPLHSPAPHSFVRSAVTFNRWSGWPVDLPAKYVLRERGAPCS